MNATLQVSALLGIAEYRASEALESLSDRADHTMYAAKVGGRNRVMAADDRGKNEGRNGRISLPGGHTEVSA